MSLHSHNAPIVDPNEQWLNACLSVRPELKFDVRHSNHETHIIVEDPVRSKFFQIGLPAYELLATLDGIKTLREAVGTNEPPPSNESSLNETQAIQIGQWLVQNNLVFSSGGDNSKRLEYQDRMNRRAKLMGWLNPISCKIPLFNPNRALTLITPYLQWIFTGKSLLIWVAVGGYAMSILFSQWEKMGAATTGILSGDSWIWLMLIWIGLKFVHEAAHGIACRRFGGEVPEAGILLLLFTPLAYVNVTSMWRFSNRWQRITVAAAGMFVELFISFVSLIVWHRFPGVIGDIAFNVFLMSSVTTILFNANPLMRFDGYFVLSDLLNIPNLYTKGTRWFGDRCQSLFLGTPPTPNIYSRQEARYVQVYGALAYFWKTTICFSLMIAASVLFHGAGIVLASVGAVMWFGLPIFKQFHRLLVASNGPRINPTRMLTSGVLTAVFCLCLFTVLKAPAMKSAPAVIQFADEQWIRAKSAGFVQEILVTSGQTVVTGQPLIQLKNDQLRLEVSELKRLAEEAKIESRIRLQDGETNLAQTAAEKQASLLKQLGEKQAQLDGLTIRAPHHGFVFQRNLDNLLGGFAKTGDGLISIAHAETKEVVVSIDQRDLESIQGQQNAFMQVAFPGKSVFQSKLKHLNPRAAINDYDASLGANVGGPLPVRPTSGGASGQSQFELLTPRFNVELELIPEIGSSLSSGQRGRAFFRTNRQSLGSYLYVAIADWIKVKIDQATQSAAF